MHIDRDGVGVMAEGRPIQSDDVVERAKDATIVRLRECGWTWQAIGRFFGISAPAVLQRSKRIPKQAREHYRKQAIRWLDSA